MAMVLLGEPVGSLVLANRGHDTFLPEWQFALFPKPTEQGRYLIALAAPLLLSVAIAILARKPPRLQPRTARVLVRAGECAGVAFIVICVWIQRHTVWGPANGYSPTAYPHGFVQQYFTPQTLLAAVALTAVATLAVNSDTVRHRVTTALSSQHRSTAVIGVAVAVLATAVWLLAGVNFGDTIRNADGSTILNVKWPLDETFAVLDGRTPFVNLILQYGSLWPLATALAMSVLGTTFGVFSLTMSTITGLSLLAVFAALRRVVGNAVLALLLYLPFLATGFFAMQPPLVDRYGGLTLYSLFPLRYAGPLLLVWLVARHLDGARPRRAWLLFLAAGLVVLNNPNFGVPALGATLAALLWIGAPWRRKGVARLLREVLTGLLAAYALLAALTLLRAGSLPRLSVLFFFSRIYGQDGWAQFPTPTLGMDIVLYLTYAAAMGTGTVLMVRRNPRRLLAGLLVWSGVFGLGIGSYYMGRTAPEALVSMFSAWTLTLALLAVAVVQQIARNPGQRPTVAHVAVLLGMSLAACSLAQTPAPWTQIERLQRTAAPIDVALPGLKRVLVSYGGGRPEALLNVLGHRIAYESGVVDVSPYAGTVITAGQVSDVLRALHDAGGRLLVLPLSNTVRSVYRAACEAGFSFVRQYNFEFEHEVGKPDGLTLWSAPTPGVAPRPCPVR
ncbi:MAG: hypothetical protein ACHQE6_06080 [Solirubrobacterales bacterium]